jgi:hypothetical protein
VANRLEHHRQFCGQQNSAPVAFTRCVKSYDSHSCTITILEQFRPLYSLKKSQVQYKNRTTHRSKSGLPEYYLIRRPFLRNLLPKLFPSNQPFSINNFASASVCARLETRSSSIVTGLLSGSAMVLPYLNTLSARARTFGGIVSPICLAALRLIASSNFVGCSTGKSAGFIPFKILSTKTAARLTISVSSGP